LTFAKETSSVRALPLPHRRQHLHHREAPTEVRRSTTPYSEEYEPILVVTVSSTGYSSDQYWSRREAVLVAITNQYWSTQRAVLVTKPPSADSI